MKPLQDWQDSLNATHGWQEDRVLKTLGSPRTVIRKTDDRAKAFAGYLPIPSQAVTNKVLVYSHLNYHGYLFINPKGIVEYVEFGGT
ncbi:MAG TPA: hypothetical protein VK934_07360 [Fimbriimonas sp.]|nr:hypothetical protein [Fimbriimonas sp.]